MEVEKLKLNGTFISFSILPKEMFSGNYIWNLITTRLYKILSVEPKYLQHWHFLSNSFFQKKYHFSRLDFIILRCHCMWICLSFIIRETNLFNIIRNVSVRIYYCYKHYIMAMTNLKIWINLTGFEIFNHS